MGRRLHQLSAFLQITLVFLCATGAFGQPLLRVDYDRYDKRTWVGSGPPASQNTRTADPSTKTLPTKTLRAIYDLASPLTGPRDADAESIGRDYLTAFDRAKQEPSAAATDWETVARYETPSANLTHLVFARSHAGVHFFESNGVVHVDGDGRVWRVDLSPVTPTAGYLSVTFSQQQAVMSAMAILAPDLDLDLDTISPEHGADRAIVFSSVAVHSEIPVRLVWFVLSHEAFPAWELFLDIPSRGAYLVVVDGNSGEILFSRNLTRHAEPWGRVFRAPDRPNPGTGNQQQEPLSGWPPSEGVCPPNIYPGQYRIGELSGRCWVDADETTGNNIDACRDVTGNNLCDDRAGATGEAFDFAFADSYAQTGNPAPDRDAALTNAFYWSNVAHDWFYALGFDEPAGNFQVDNFGLGGAEVDPVRVDIEDSSVVNNATFVTPPDGISPRMQLGLFTWSRRDSAFDADLIMHEYTHGLTTRLVGGPNDVTGLFLWQSGALSEGWSDAYAASFLDDPVFGDYVTGNPTSGMRTVAYDNSTYTYGHVGTLSLKVIPGTGRLLRVQQVHRDGEVWAGVLWDLRAALGKSDFEHTITTGLKLTPSRPSMLDARDAILQAAQLLGVGGANGCPLWSVFAARGFGSSAVLNPIEVSQPTDTALSVYESFDLPAACGGAAPSFDTALLFEDAESGGGGWEATGLWHISPRRSADGGYSWWYGQDATGDYDTGGRTFGSLTSPAIDLTASTGAIVEWDQYLDGEGFGAAISLGGGGGAYLNADSGRLMISTDDGVSWRTLSHLAHNTSTAAFERHKVNLTAYAGQAIHLRFDFDTFDADSNDHEGWFIDNIRVSRLTTVEPPVTTLAEWSFDEPGAGSGVTISDASGGGHDGVTQSSGTIAVPGVSGNGRLLNGSTDSIDFGSAAELTPASFTVRTWIRIRSYPPSLGMVLSAYGGNYKGWWLGLNPQGRLLFLAARSPSAATWLSTASPLALDRWYGVTVTYDHLTQQASLYVDGTLEAQATTAGIEAETALPLLAGKASWFPGYYLDFAIDETRINSGVWSAQEVATDFALFSPPPAAADPSVTARWSFEAGAEDVSGNQHHSNLYGATIEPGVSGDALRFDGVNNSIAIPWSPRLTPSRFSLRAWIKLASYPGGLGMVMANYGGNYQGWYLAVQSGGRLVLAINRLPAVARGLQSASVLGLDQWYHVTATYDGKSQQMRLFLDGVLDAQGYAAGLTPRDSGSVTIGSASWYNGSFLDFTIDEVELLPDVWSPADVQDDFTAFPNPSPLYPVATWGFDDSGDGPGITLSDSSGEGHDAVTAGSGTTAVVGTAGQARRFDGSSDFATLSPHPDLSTADFSFTAWIKLEQQPLSWGVIFSNYGGDYQGWFCGVNSAGHLMLSIAGLPTHAGWLVSNASLDTGRWYHIAFTFNQATRRGAIYIDGALDRTAVFNGFTPQVTVQPTVGRASWYNGAYLGMTLDTARLYPGELSALEVAADYSSP